MTDLKLHMASDSEMDMVRRLGKRVVGETEHTRFVLYWYKGRMYVDSLVPVTPDHEGASD